MPDFALETPHGILSITDTGLKTPSPALLLLHGNSSSSKIFRPFFSSPLTATHRLITFDLPGHGASSNAPHPQSDYTMSGYAACAVHVLEHLGVERAVLLGWSLGGHVALSMVPELKRASERACRRVEVAGIVLTGTPPALGAEQCSRGFKIATSHQNSSDPTGADANLMAAVHWTHDQADAISRSSAPNNHPRLFEPWMRADAIRTDGRARSIMFSAFLSGANPDGTPGVDQVRIVETEDVPIAVINGADEPFVELGYLDALRWRRLWGGECVRMEGLGHAPFWEDPDGYVAVLERFLGDVGGEGEE